MHVKMLSGKWQRFCLGLNVLTNSGWDKMVDTWQMIFSVLKQLIYCLPVKYNIHITQVSSQIWMRFEKSSWYFCKSRTVLNRKNDEHTFSSLHQNGLKKREMRSIVKRIKKVLKRKQQKQKIEKKWGGLLRGLTTIRFAVNCRRASLLP